MPKLNLLNIQELVQRAKDEAMPVSEYTIRRAIRSGSLPCRQVGRTYLILWANFLRWIGCEDGADNAPAPCASGIRRVEV